MNQKKTPTHVRFSLSPPPGDKMQSADSIVNSKKYTNSGGYQRHSTETNSPIDGFSKRTHSGPVPTRPPVSRNERVSGQNYSTPKLQQSQQPPPSHRRHEKALKKSHSSSSLPQKQSSARTESATRRSETSRNERSFEQNHSTSNLSNRHVPTGRPETPRNDHSTSRHYHNSGGRRGYDGSSPRHPSYNSRMGRRPCRSNYSRSRREPYNSKFSKPYPSVSPHQWQQWPQQQWSFPDRGQYHDYRMYPEDQYQHQRMPYERVRLPQRSRSLQTAKKIVQKSIKQVPARKNEIPASVRDHMQQSALRFGTTKSPEAGGKTSVDNMKKLISPKSRRTEVQLEKIMKKGEESVVKRRQFPSAPPPIAPAVPPLMNMRLAPQQTENVTVWSFGTKDAQTCSTSTAAQLDRLRGAIGKEQDVHQLAKNKKSKAPKKSLKIYQSAEPTATDVSIPRRERSKSETAKPTARRNKRKQSTSLATPAKLAKTDPVPPVSTTVSQTTPLVDLVHIDCSPQPDKVTEIERELTKIRKKLDSVEIVIKTKEGEHNEILLTLQHELYPKRSELKDEIKDLESRKEELLLTPDPAPTTTTKCSMCDSDLGSDLHLEFHRQALHGAYDSRCKLCNVVMQSKYGEIQHYREAHPLAPFHMCEICGYKFDTQKQLGLHQVGLHQPSREMNICKFCTATFATAYQLNHHERAEHSDCLSAKRTFPCRFCGKQYVYLKRHEDSLHLNVVYPCPICRQKLSTTQSRKRHIRLKHPGVLPPAGTRNQTVVAPAASSHIDQLLQSLTTSDNNSSAPGRSDQVARSSGEPSRRKGESSRSIDNLSQETTTAVPGGQIKMEQENSSSSSDSETDDSAHEECDTIANALPLVKTEEKNPVYLDRMGDSNTEQTRCFMPSHSGSVTGIIGARSGKILMTCGFEGSIQSFNMFNMRTCRIPHVKFGNDLPLTLQYTALMVYKWKLYAGSADGSVVCFRYYRKTEFYSPIWLKHFRSRVRCMAAGFYLLVGLDDGRVFKCDGKLNMKNRRAHFELLCNLHSNIVAMATQHSSEYSDDNSLVVIATGDGQVLVRNHVSSGGAVLRHLENGAGTTVVCMEQHNDHIYTCSDDRVVRKIDLTSGHLLLKTDIFHAKFCCCSAISGSEVLCFIVASMDGYIHCLDPETLNERKSYRLDSESLPTALSLWDPWIFVGSSDGSIQRLRL